MKLRDPGLEALLEAYREERRPSEAVREELWERVAEHRRPRRAWARGVVAAVVAVAALVLLWLVVRGLSGEVARARGPESGAQAPFGHEGARARGAASAAGGKAASAEAAVDERVVEPPPGDAPAPADEGREDRASERGAAAGSRSGIGSAPAIAEPRPEPEPVPGPKVGAPLDDLALIEAAEAALRTGAPARALELLRDHEARFPSAPSAEEREALRVLALCAAGREVEGRGARWAFLRAHPRSAYRERIEKACPASSMRAGEN